MVEEAGRDHEAGVDGASDDPENSLVGEQVDTIGGASSQRDVRVEEAGATPAQRVPGTIIEPVVEVVEAFVCEVFRGAVVEVRVKLVDHRFKPGE